MRELSAEARLHLYARSLSRKTGTGFHSAALYGAFAVIATIAFGTLSVHPFLALARLLERRHLDAGVFQRLPDTAGDFDRTRRVAVNANGVGSHLDHLAGD